MALLLHCKQGSVRVNGELVTGGITVLPEGAVIEPMTESKFEVLMTQTVAETAPEPRPGIPPILTSFPPSVFLGEIREPRGETRVWLLQTPEGSVRFASCASPVPVAPSA